MTRRELDKNRPYGEVYNHGDARYEQHGILFDGSGKELPGFEEIEVPAEDPKAPETVDVSALKNEIVVLKKQILLLKSDFEVERNQAAEDLEAEVEAVQGQLDTANVDIGRLSNELTTLKAVQPETAEDSAETVNELSVAVYGSIQNATELKALLANCSDQLLVRSLIDLETNSGRTRNNWMAALQGRLDELQGGGSGDEQASLLDDQVAAQGQVDS